MNNTIYELAFYDHLYEYDFYWHFKKDNTSVHRIKKFLRESLREDTGYFEDDVKDNIKALHLLKSADSIEGIMSVLNGTGWKLKEKELL